MNFDRNNHFSLSGNISAAGHVKYVTDDPSFMFLDCTSLIDASQLTVASSMTSCESMFEGCTSLIAAPQIPSTPANFQKMFYNCASLREMPELTA